MSEMNRYLRILLLFSCLNIGGKIVHSQWHVENSPTICNLNAITSAGFNDLWIVGDFGTILHKKDDSWHAVSSPTLENLYGVFFLSKNQGWAVGAKGTILRYNGEAWEKYDSPVKSDLTSVSFIDKENGAAVGKSGTIIIYESGTWSLKPNIQRGDFYSVFYTDNNYWFGGGLECVNFPIFKFKGTPTKKSEITENYQSLATIKSIHFLNASNGWAVGSPSIILHYNGSSWQKDSDSKNFSSLNSVFFLNDSSGLAVGMKGTLLRYYKNSWTKEQSGTDKHLKGALIVDGRFYAVGNNGTILSDFFNVTTGNSFITQSTPIPVQDISNNNSKEPSPEFDSIRLSLSPNPCNEFVEIKIIGITGQKPGLISITDMKGQLLLQKEIKTEGMKDNSTILRTDDFMSSTYVLKLSIGEQTVSQMFIVKH